MSSVPLVSVVIPTHLRPKLVAQAVRSALAQTLRSLEVVVVIDGAARPTSQALAVIDDERLRVVASPTRLGNGGARNVGIDSARGRWVALLDDDDLWEPEKLALQLRAARSSPWRYPVVSCRLRAATEQRSFVWPRRLPGSREPLSEYLFCRHRPWTGEGLIQTSTILAPTELFQRVPFQLGLPRFVDLDWILRVDRLEDAAVVFAAAPKPLVHWRIEANRPRVTHQAGWRFDLEWIRERAHLVTPRARAAFLLTLASSRAAREGDHAAFAALLAESFRASRPSSAELLYHLGNFALPNGLCANLAGWLGGERKRASDRTHERSSSTRTSAARGGADSTKVRAQR